MPSLDTNVKIMLKNLSAWQSVCLAPTDTWTPHALACEDRDEWPFPGAERSFFLLNDTLRSTLSVFFPMVISVGFHELRRDFFKHFLQMETNSAHYIQNGSRF